MDYSNYTLFEIIKYKIEFLECLEYTLLSNTLNEDEIKNHLTYLKSEINEGLYKEITSTLFTSFKLLNEPLIKFLNNYNFKTINKIAKKRKIANYIKYNEYLIEVYETFNYIINAFTEEEKISSLLIKELSQLINDSNNYFINFLFFNCYNLYLNCFYNEKQRLRFTNRDIIKLTSIINYCNKENKFNEFINVLQTENKIRINEEFEKLSNICIESEKRQESLLNKIIEKINNQSKNT